jgi:4-hydroxy-tetrahydrodipicolinate reductase
MNSLKLLVTGCKGRMGQAVWQAAELNPATDATRGIDVGDALLENLSACDAVIDFSHWSFTSDLLDACVAQGKPLVIGTTGHHADVLAKIEATAQKLPIVKAGNFSIGVNTLFWLTRKAAEILGTDFDLEVLEMHHNKKLDAPSGTARRLVEVLTEVRNLSYEDDVRHGRVGDVGKRTQQEIGLHAIRGGDVVGDHTVIFAAQGERVELTHKASNREIFATGSVRAALWLRDKAPGLYDMEDVLGFRA